MLKRIVKMLKQTPTFKSRKPDRKQHLRTDRQIDQKSNCVVRPAQVEFRSLEILDPWKPIEVLRDHFRRTLKILRGTGACPNIC